MSVRRLLRYYGALKGAKQPQLDRAIDQWLERMGLSAWIDKRIDSLSKGMAQKIQFIAAVLNKPRLLILDEPFTGLDPVNAEVLKDAVLDLKKAGTTMVFSTHDMGVADRLCDRIFMIFKGRKVLDGTLEEIQSNYGSDTDSNRDRRGRGVLDGLPEVEEINDHGNLQEVKWGGDPQVLARIPGRSHPGHSVRGHAPVAARHLRENRRARSGRKETANCALIFGKSGSSRRRNSPRRSAPSRS